MSTSWPPTHSFPRCTWLSHLLGRFVLWASGWKVEGQVPDGVPKAVLIAAPHTSNWDFVFALAAGWALGLRIRWLGKDALFKPPLGWLLRPLGGLAVDRSKPHGMVGEVARSFREVDAMLLMVPAEGTRSRRDYWKSGFYFMAKEAGVPILAGYLDYGRKVASTGIPLQPSSDVRADMDVLRAHYDGRVGAHPQHFSPVRLRQEDPEV